MNTENEIFKRKKLKINTLLPYGFTKSNGIYVYSKAFMNSFRADIFIDETGFVAGKVHDLDVDEEYTNFRIKNLAGGFANAVRMEYFGILNDIAKNCFEELFFISDQANRITKLISEKYHDKPEFLWEKHSGYGVFRNPDTKKWYAIIMNIDKNKIDKACSGETEIINVKLEPEEVQNLLSKQGFYQCYHMNKKNWITIISDNTLSDETVFEYIEKSRTYSV